MNENTRQAVAEAEARRQQQQLQQQPVATRTRRSSNTSSITTSSHQDALNGVESLGHTNNISDCSMDAFTTDEIVTILEKEESTRDLNELRILKEWSFLIPEASAKIRAKRAKSVIKQRSIEREESMESIESKAETLAKLIKEAKNTVIYTGAGISTSASIPDYRGPNGLWTQIKKTGTFSITQIHDLSLAEPTFTHMAIKELCRRKIVKHVVSQNCDGLHIRSGIPQKTLSEIHGNMYIEVCPSCEKQYFRQADVTERTSRFRHKTGRKCHTCAEPNNNLIDTIVLFGERSRTQWPMNWERAGKTSKKADLIICMGSSLKTLRSYVCLWPERTNKEQPKTKLVIINLQYTPKDKHAVLKINGRCDLVMQLVMQRLNINVPAYDWSLDPLNHLATPFTPDERANLKRNLVFESKVQRQSSASPTLKRELSESPSLFVSEITDDPVKKRLRMRIRALDAKSTSPTESSNNDETPTETSYSPSFAKEQEMVIKKPAAPLVGKVNYSIPGWLGKSLGANRSTSYRRKRHGNKGKKHSSVLKQQQSEELDLGEDEQPDSVVDKVTRDNAEESNGIIVDSTSESDFILKSETETLVNAKHLNCSQQHSSVAKVPAIEIIKQETLISNQS